MLHPPPNSAPSPSLHPLRPAVAPSRFACLLLLTALAVSPALAIAADPPPAPSPAASLGFDLADMQGRLHPLSQNDRRVVRVFVFLSTACPISNSYSAELNRLAQFARQPRTHEVQFFGVVSDSSITRAAAKAHFDEYRVEFPVLFDAAGLLAKALRPTRVPEAFVIDADSQSAYRGAIDNAYEAIGRRRATVTKFYLRDAIQAAADGAPAPVAQTPAVGCVFPDPTHAAARGDVTYTRHIAPLIQSRCLNCHRDGQAAPFSLHDFAATKRHAAMLVEVTRERLMPPWMPAAGEQPKLVGQRRLTDDELELLQRWHADGCPEGDASDLPPAPQFAEGWQLGEPDLIVKMQQPFTVRAEGPDLLQNFVIPIDIPEDKLVAAVEFHPGNKRVVHHAVLFLDEKGQARKLDAATPEPGYGNFGGPGFLPSGALGGWSVGNTARRLPDDMGRYLKKGSDLVVQIHYHPTGKEEVDQSELGLYFVPRPLAESLAAPAKLVGSIWLANYQLDIPPGESRYEMKTTYVLPKEVIMVGVVPHMHLLGKSMEAVAVLPDGRRQPIVNVPAWNYNWQDEYYFERPFKLPAKTRLEVTAVYDNSADNPSNPSSPPRRMTWGDETTDEMLFCFFLLTAEKPADLIHVILDNLGHDLRQPRKKVER